MTEHSSENFPAVESIYRVENQLVAQTEPATLDARVYATRRFLSNKEGVPDLWLSAGSVAMIGGEQVSFAVPSHAALCLNISQFGFRHLRAIDVPRLFEKTASGEKTAQAGLSTLYSAFEMMLVNTVFAYTALEAYANQIIPDSFVLTKTRQDKRCTEEYSKSQIERFISLDTKISEVLPEVTGVPFEKGGRLWNDYTNLRDVRDRIIHVKTEDLGIHDQECKSLWTLLLDRHRIDSSLVAHAIIKHFPQKKENTSPVSETRNGWVKVFPFGIKK